MNDTLIYVEDELLDLFDKTAIAITFQKIDVGNVKGRSLNYTSQVKLPKTPNNDRIFESAAEESSTTGKPYRYLTCKVIQDGQELIPEGIMYITDVDDDYAVSIFENAIALFSALEGLKLNEINIVPVSGWNPTDIDAARTSTSGIVTAVMSWGRSLIYEEDFFLPSFYYHTIITTILEYTGLTLEGSILTDARFTDLVVPFSAEAWEYPEGHKAIGSARAYTDVDLEIFTDIGDGTYDYTMQVDSISGVIFNNGYASVSTPALVWDGLSEVRASVTVAGTIDVDVTIGTPTWDIYAVLYINGVQIDLSTSLLDETLTPTGGPIGFTFDPFTISEGDEVTVGIRMVVVGVSEIDVDASNQAFTINVSPVVDRDFVSWNMLFNPVECLDVLSDFFTRFGLVYKQEGNTLVLKSLEEICSETTDVTDWSANKVVDKKESMSFKTSYAQNNNFEYNDYTENGLGTGTIQVANTTLPLSKNAFTSVFDNCRTTTVQTNYYVAKIPVYTNSSTGIEDFDDSPGLKILTLKARDAEPAITFFGATPRTDFKLAYFIDEDQAKDTGFQYFLDQFYPLFRAALQKTKTKNKFYNLEAVDVFKYDPLKMMYDGEGYYIVNKMPSYVPGKFTKVEIFKII